MLARSFKTALPFAEDLAAKNIKLAPNPSTILSELMILSTPLEFERPVEVPALSGDSYNQAIDSYGHALQFHTEGEAGAAWAGSFDSLVESLSRSLNVQISYIRNTVQPRLNEFVSDAQAYMQDLGKHNPASELEIRRNCLPELVTDPAFLTILEPHKLKAIARPGEFTLGLNVKAPPEDFLELTTLSNKRLDGLVKAWASSCDFNYLESAWYSFFAGQDLTRAFRGPYISQDEMSSPDLHIRLNTALAYFLFANYYMNHKPDVVTSESTTSLDRRIFDHQRYAGSVLCDTLQQIQQAHAANNMVMFIDTFHKKISVHGEIYDRWLQAGGSSEIILGLLVSNKRMYNVEQIDKAADELKRAWANYSRVNVEGVEWRKADTLRTFYKELMRKYLSNDYTEELEESFVLQNPHHYEYAMRDAEAYIKNLSKSDLMQPYPIARRLIAGLKYSFTNAEQFMIDMAQATDGVDKPDAEEAAAVATINYIVDYVQGQIAVIRG